MAVRQNGMVLGITNDWKDDEEVVTIAVGNYGKSLFYASQRLKNNQQIVKVAVKMDGLSLKFASFQM